MKKICAIFLLLPLGCIFLYGQTTLSLSGDVLDNGVGVANQAVFISIVSSQNGGFSLDDTTFTDNSGLFSLSPSLDAGITYANITAYTLDCTGNFYAADSAVFTGGTTNFSFSIDYCPPANCLASFTSNTSPGSNTVQFTSNSYGTNQSTTIFHQWDFGDGNTSSLKDPSHTYGSFGTYYVCLGIYDSLTACDDYICDSVTVTGSAACNTSFTQTLNGLDAQFTSYSSGSPGTSFSYHWDFGDGSTSTLEHPSYTYANPGLYSVCLTITDTALNCTDTQCKTLIVQHIGTYTVSGFVLTPDSTGVSSATVYLIVHDSVAGTLSAIDSTQINQDPYTFVNVSPGTYLIKAALLPGDPDYASLLPTYLGNELYWNNSSPVVVSNSAVSNQHIFLIQGNNPGGPGFIGGLISQGANKGPGDPIANISVLLRDENQHPISHTLTDANGEYGFSNLALGSYEVHVEIPGKQSIAWELSLTNDIMSFMSAHFEVGDSTVSPVNTTAIESFSFGKIIHVYPNPVTDLLHIDLAFQHSGKVNLALINSLGQSVKQQNIMAFPGTETFTLSMKDLSTGIYHLRIASGEEIVVKRVIKK
ncbi:MAG: PKD domain-containing protein [Bacteroidota bacterium]